MYIFFSLFIGRKSKQSGKFFASKYCFETAHKMNPTNIVAIENLIEIYFIINEFYNCANMCVFALEVDSDYSKALIILNECLTFDSILMRDFDRDYLKFVSRNLGGKLDMEKLLENIKFENFKSNLLKRLRKEQTLLFISCDEED